MKKKSNMMGITVDELLAEITELEEESPAGFTTREFAKRIKGNLEYARSKLRELAYDGRIECVGRRRTMAMDGRASTTPVYRIVRSE